MRCAAVGLAAAITLISLTSAGSAPPAHLTLAGCPRLDESEVRRVFSADLGTELASARAPEVTEVTVYCELASVRVRVEDPLSRKVAERSFASISFADDGASRLVAIAASELVLGSWAELGANLTPTVRPEGPEPALPLLRAARETVREKSLTAGLLPARAAAIEPQRKARADPGLRLVGLTSVRSFFDGRGTLWGGGVRVGAEPTRILSWSSDAMVEGGSFATATGRFNVTTATLGGWLMAYQRIAQATLRFGAGLRAGLLRSSPQGASAAPGGSMLAPWGWPLAALSGSMRFGRVVVDLSSEAGYVVLPLRGDSEPEARGAWFSGQIGLGFVLSPKSSAAVVEEAAW